VWTLAFAVQRLKHLALSSKLALQVAFCDGHSRVSLGKREALEVHPPSPDPKTGPPSTGVELVGCPR
jgi:prepilin-type processing-associated H-X9-DG protein